jgi:hypothetical protein
MTEDITDALHRAAELLPDTPDRLQAVRRKRAGLVRRRMSAAGAALAVIGGGLAYGLTRDGGSSTVVRQGAPAEFTASGMVVQPAGEGARLCVNLPSDLMYRGPQPIVRCRLGVDVTGVDLGALRQRRDYQGGIEGYASLTGHLDGDTLVVTKQGIDQEAREDFILAPDCQPPAGGWKRLALQQNPSLGPLQRYQSAHPDEVAEIAVARPTSDTAFPYLLTWGDPATARAALTQDYGDQVCVLQSRWTHQEVTSAANDVAAAARTEDTYMYGSGHTFGRDGQLLVDAEAVRSTPALEAIVARYPKGLIRIDYWLHPVTP